MPDKSNIEEYSALLDKQHAETKKKLRGARTEAERTRHFSDLHSIESMQRKVRRGEYPGRSEDE